MFDFGEGFVMDFDEVLYVVLGVFVLFIVVGVFGMVFL